MPLVMRNAVTGVEGSGAVPQVQLLRQQRSGPQRGDHGDRLLR